VDRPRAALERNRPIGVILEIAQPWDGTPGLSAPPCSACRGGAAPAPAGRARRRRHRRGLLRNGLPRGAGRARRTRCGAGRRRAGSRPPTCRPTPPSGCGS